MPLSKGLVLVFFLLFSTTSPANTRHRGDNVRLLLPLTAAAGALAINDMTGVSQLGITMLVTTGATEGLKLATRERRPNGYCCESFPSGHTSAAFGGAAFIHNRFGFVYSIPFYLAASYVGYSRVYAHSHYTHDVIAGAGVGILSAWLSTTAYKDIPIAFTFHGKYAGIIYRKLFD